MSSPNYERSIPDFSRRLERSATKLAGHLEHNVSHEVVQKRWEEIADLISELATRGDEGGRVLLSLLHSPNTGVRLVMAIALHPMPAFEAASEEALTSVADLCTPTGKTAREYLYEIARPEMDDLY